MCEKRDLVEQLSTDSDIVTHYLFSTYTMQPSRLIVRSGLDVPTFVTRRLHPAAEGATVGEKCPRILPKMSTSTLHLGIFYMP